MKTTLLALAAALLTSTVSAQGVAICDASSAHKRIMLYDAITGNLINKDFIPSPGPGYAFSRPREVLSVGNELWVIDQAQDKIFRFSQAGAFIASISGVDDPRGGTVVAGVVHVSNTGSGGGAPGPAVIQFDFSGNMLSNFATTGPVPYDIIPFNGDLLISDLTNDNIHRYSTGGADLGSFTNATKTMLNPQQIAVGSNGNVFAAAQTAPSGLYQYDQNSGNELSVQTVAQNTSGLFQLPNGNWLMGHNSGVLIFNPVSLQVMDVTPPDGAQVHGISPIAAFFATKFCVSKTTTVCGTSSIGFFGSASATGTSGFTVTAGPARGCRKGILLYSNQPSIGPIPFGGAGDGMLCMSGVGLSRAAPIDSGGTPNACDGLFSIDLNAFRNQSWSSTGCAAVPGQTTPAAYLSTPGSTVNAQMWGRDSTTTGQLLSDGLNWTILP